MSKNLDYQLITLPKAAEKLGIPVVLMRKLVKEGSIPALVDRRTLKISMFMVQRILAGLQYGFAEQLKLFGNDAALRPYNPNTDGNLRSQQKNRDQNNRGGEEDIFMIVD